MFVSLISRTFRLSVSETPPQMMKISARDSVTWKPESTAAGLISLTAEPKEAITVEEAENKVAEFGASEKAEIEQVERTPAAPRTELSV